MFEKVKLTYEEIRALASDTRKDILKRLLKKPHTATRLSKILKKHVTTISEHLDILEEAGLVERIERPGRKWVFYQITQKGRKILRPKKPVYIAITLAVLILTVSVGFYVVKTWYIVPRGAIPIRSVEELVESANHEQLEYANCEIKGESLKASTLAKRWNSSKVSHIRTKCLERNGHWKPEYSEEKAPHSATLKKLANQTKKLKTKCSEMGIC